jgi:DNA-binding response OmpR family regulator
MQPQSGQPIVPNIPSAAANSDVQLPTQPITGVQPKYKNILCIEDEHFIGELYSRALDKAGYSVTTVVDGTQGLEEAKTNKYDIILLDIMLPGMTGVDLLRQLRATTPDLKAKVIITTNLEQSDTSKEEIEKQADGYIIKAEITPKQLVDFLQGLE